MLTTLSILSRDQGKLTRRPASEEAWFARFHQVTPPAQGRMQSYTLRHLWPLLRRAVRHQPG